MIALLQAGSAIAGPTAPSTTAATQAEESRSRNADIIVTASRRAERMSDVPLSIMALDQTELDQKHVRSMADLSRFIPGLTFSPGWGDTSHVSIRGIASAVGASTTGIYLDNTPIQIRNLGASGTATNAWPAIFDLERVEVLRGPQGTLFGAGSAGGAIRFITPAPAFIRPSARVRVEQAFIRHGSASTDIGGAIGLPVIADKVALRISGNVRRDGGWVDRVDPQTGNMVDANANSVRTLSLRAALAFKPAENLTITPAIFHHNRKQRDSSFIWRHLSDPDAGQFHNGQPLRQPASDRFELYSLDVAYDAGFATLFSTTSYFERNNRNLLDYTTFGAELLGLDYRAGYLTGALLPAQTDNRQHIFTQEIRLQSAGSHRLQWLLGVFYQNARQSAAQDIGSENGDMLTQAIFGTNVEGVFGVPLVQPGDRFFTARDRARDRQIAGFGQLDFNITPALTATAGMRVTHTDFQSRNAQDGPFNGGPSGGLARHSETPITPKFGLQYRPDRDVMLYASAARGFRIGGGNAPVPVSSCGFDLATLGLTQAPEGYAPDSLWSYEVGVKASAFDRRLRIEGSAFRIDWQNIQNAVALRNCGFAYIDNLGKARSQGFDLHGTVSPLPGLTLEGALAYTHARLRNTVSGGLRWDGQREIIAAKGDPLNIAPWKISLSGRYEFPVQQQSAMRFYIAGDYQYSSGYDFGSAQTAGYDPFNPRQAATHIAGLRTGLQLRELDIAVFADNLFNSTDRLAIGHNTLASGLFREALFRPRTIGVTASYRY